MKIINLKGHREIGIIKRKHWHEETKKKEEEEEKKTLFDSFVKIISGDETI